MQGNYLSPIIDACKPILIFAAVLWGIEIIITMLIKDHKKAKRKQAREKRRLEYQDRRMANDAEHAKVTRAIRYDVLRRDNFRCVRCGRGKEDGVKLHVDHIVPVSRGGKSVIEIIYLGDVWHTMSSLMPHVQISPAISRKTSLALVVLFLEKIAI